MDNMDKDMMDMKEMEDEKSAMKSEMKMEPSMPHPHHAAYTMPTHHASSYHTPAPYHHMPHHAPHHQPYTPHTPAYAHPMPYHPPHHAPSMTYHHPVPATTYHHEPMHHVSPTYHHEPMHYAHPQPHHPQPHHPQPHHPTPSYPSSYPHTTYHHQPHTMAYHHPTPTPYHHPTPMPHHYGGAAHPHMVHHPHIPAAAPAHHMMMKPEMMKDEMMKKNRNSAPPAPTNAVATETPRYLGKFTKATHNVDGDIFMLDDHTLYIQGFSFDGQAPDVHFWSDGVAIH